MNGADRSKLEKLYKLKGDFSAHATNQRNANEFMQNDFVKILKWILGNPLSVFLHKYFFVRLGFTKFKLDIADIRKRIDVVK